MHGRVDWVHLSEIYHAISSHRISLNIPEFLVERTTRPPLEQPIVAEALKAGAILDWAGVEGVWKCAYCFCDHTDLLRKSFWGLSITCVH